MYALFFLLPLVSAELRQLQFLNWLLPLWKGEYSISWDAAMSGHVAYQGLRTPQLVCLEKPAEIMYDLFEDVLNQVTEDSTLEHRNAMIDGMVQGMVGACDRAGNKCLGTSIDVKRTAHILKDILVSWTCATILPPEDWDMPNKQCLAAVKRLDYLRAIDSSAPGGSIYAPMP